MTVPPLVGLLEAQSQGEGTLISVAHMYRLKEGASDPRWDLVLAICEVFDVPPSYFSSPVRLDTPGFAREQLVGEVSHVAVQEVPGDQTLLPNTVSATFAARLMALLEAYRSADGSALTFASLFQRVQKYSAEGFPVSKAQMYRLRKGDSMPRWGLIMEICRVFDVSPDYFSQGLLSHQ